jgi:hypothetical protein
MAYTKIIKYETLRSIDSATFTGAYQAIGGPLLHPISLIKMVNNSTMLVTISIDGVTAVDVCPAGSFWLYDITSNTPTHGDDAIFIPQGTQYYVEGTAGTGLVYLTALYIVQV